MQLGRNRCIPDYGRIMVFLEKFLVCKLIDRKCLGCFKLEIG
jgi:hypothetical protein